MVAAVHVPLPAGCGQSKHHVGGSGLRHSVVHPSDGPLQGWVLPSRRVLLSYRTGGLATAFLKTGQAAAHLGQAHCHWPFLPESPSPEGNHCYVWVVRSV